MKIKMVLALLMCFSFNSFAKDVDLAKTTFNWKVDKKLGKGHFGDIKLKSAKAEIGKDGKVKSGEFVMDMNSFTVEELEGEWKQKFLGHVKSDDFFKTDKFPTAKLVIDKQVGKNQVSGKLTILGKTNPVKIKFKKSGDSYSGKFVFDRTKWGIIYGSGNFFKKLAADKIIKNEIELDFNVVLK